MFFGERLEFRERFEISRPAGRALEMNQFRERNRATTETEQVDLERRGEQLFVWASADDLAKEIEIAT